MTKEPEWVTTSIDERMHDLGDRMHGQVTEFDPSNPLRPGRYWFGINPDDASVVICVDIQTEPKRVMGHTVTEETLWVLEWIRECIKIGKQNRIVLRRKRKRYNA
jgi:hypothetical protein